MEYFDINSTSFGVISLRFRFMVFNATFNNISAIAWLLVLLVALSGVRTHNVSGDRH
jgi:hypothetical protein